MFPRPVEFSAVLRCLVACVERPRAGLGRCWPSRFAGVALLLLVALSPARTAELEQDMAGEAERLFESQVRPLLLASCVSCHGADEQSGGLRLDSREGLLRGGDGGAVVVPGDVEASRLVQAVRRQADLQMPPDRPLDEVQVTALVEWVRAGAPWPEAPTAGGSSLAAAARAHARRSHWAFQPLVRPAVPAEFADGGSAHPLDAFIRQTLARHGISGSPPADRRTLIRRLTCDLTGLPPTPAEVEAFVADAEPLAYERLVDRLLDSPRYGQQWARHWLDVARYSDTKGYVYAREERFFVHAATYRDWVVDAFNDDLPYDRFLSLQIAADQVDAGNPESLAAMGFLTLGRRFLGVTHDIIDDRIDVVCRGTMGLTVGCARCHDHKYDPISTAEYYGLYGVFQNSREQMVPIPPAASGTPAGDERFTTELASRQAALEGKYAEFRRVAADRVRQRVADYLAAQLALDEVPPEGFDQLLTSTDLFPSFVRRWEAYLHRALQQQDPVFLPWHAYRALPADRFATEAVAVTERLQHSEASRIPARVLDRFRTPPASMREVVDRYAEMLREVDAAWNTLCSAEATAGRPAPSSLPDRDAERVRQVLHGIEGPCEVPAGMIITTESFFTLDECVELWKLQGEVDRWLLQAPASVRYAMKLVDREEVLEPRVLRRGNPKDKGEQVPRRFLDVAAGTAFEDDAPANTPANNVFQHGSGRRELAEAIVSPNNPLTARVWVNRVWMHHFGRGLVRTPSDFGLRAEPPSHPELLDWLADRFRSEGWSTKALHRWIVTSDTYRQSCQGPANEEQHRAAMLLDPENRLLWRMNARRLAFEEHRDALLAVSGELDDRLDGRAEELFPSGRDNVRRTLYGLIDRQFLPGVHRVFDFANPDLHIPQRSETSVPQQALFSMNHPFVADRARALARRSLPEDSASRAVPGDEVSAEDAAANRQRAQRLWQFALQRHPTAEELDAALRYVEEANAAEGEETAVVPSAWRYGVAEVEEATGALREFRDLPHFAGEAWQGGPQFPDATFGWAQLTAQGGHPGNDLRHAVVRRWTAPRELEVSVRSTIRHEPKEGDGVRCWIVVNGVRVLGTWQVREGEQAAQVERLRVAAGDTIDFVVDVYRELNNDQFLWAPEIVAEANAGDAPGEESRWAAAGQFRGPPPRALSPWEQLAQVLLLSNELMFVD